MREVRGAAPASGRVTRPERASAIRDRGSPGREARDAAHRPRGGAATGQCVSTSEIAMAIMTTAISASRMRQARAVSSQRPR